VANVDAILAALGQLYAVAVKDILARAKFSSASRGWPPHPRAITVSGLL
jgi:hypothetical protein